MAVTLKMLSEQTGFSPATISRVLNNDPSMTVGEDTRRIIFDAAHRLGYSGAPAAAISAPWQIPCLLASQKCSLLPSR